MGPTPPIARALFGQIPAAHDVAQPSGDRSSSSTASVSSSSGTQSHKCYSKLLMLDPQPLSYSTPCICIQLTIQCVLACWITASDRASNKNMLLTSGQAHLVTDQDTL